MTNNDTKSWQDQKKPMCTTLQVKDRAIFYILAYKTFGYGKYSIQKAVLESIQNWNHEKLRKYPAGSPERIALEKEIEDFLKADMKKDRLKELSKKK